MIAERIVRPGSTITLDFATYDSNGGSVAISGFALTDIEIFRDGSATTRASDSGYALLDTDGIDVASQTGIHGASVDLADNSDSGFFRPGSRYKATIASVTCDGQTVNVLVDRFYIGYPGAMLDTYISGTPTSQTEFVLAAGPAENDAINGMWAIIHDGASAVQQARVLILDYVGSTKTVTLAAAPTFTIAANDGISVMGPAPLQPATTGQTLAVESDGMAHADVKEIGGTTQTARDIGASVLLSPGTGTGQISLSSGAVTVGTNNDKTGYSLTNLTVQASTTLATGTHTAQTGDAYAYLGTNLGAAGANATEAGGDGDHLTEAGGNGDHLTEAGGTGDQFTAVPWNAAWDTEVQSEVEDGLAAYDPPTRTEATADKDAILDKVLAYFQLTARDDAAIATDRATELGEINNNEGSGAGAFDNTTGSLEASYTFHSDADTYLSGLDTRVPAALTGAGNMKCDALAISGDATAADTLELFAEALDQATGQLDSGSFQTGAIASGAFASGAITAASIAANALTSAKFASDWTDRLETDILAILEGNAVTDFTAMPASTPTYSEALGMVAAAILNKVISDRTAGKSYIHDGDNNVIGEATITDDGDTFTRTKYAAP